RRDDRDDVMRLFGEVESLIEQALAVLEDEAAESVIGIPVPGRLGRRAVKAAWVVAAFERPEGTAGPGGAMPVFLFSDGRIAITRHIRRPWPKSDWIEPWSVEKLLLTPAIEGRGSALGDLGSLRDGLSGVVESHRPQP